MTWIIDNLGLIAGLAAVHLQQSMIALVLGVVVSVPLGWIAWRYRLVRGPVIVLTGLLYTIPSLALLILLPALLGYSAISPTNLVVALTIYNVAILVRVGRRRPRLGRCRRPAGGHRHGLRIRDAGSGRWSCRSRAR